MNEEEIKKKYNISSNFIKLSDDVNILKFNMSSLDYYISFRKFSNDEAKSYRIDSDLSITENTYVVDFDLISNYESNSFFQEPYGKKVCLKTTLGMRYLFDFSIKNHLNAFGGDLYLATPVSGRISTLYRYLFRAHSCYTQTSLIVSYHEDNFKSGGEISYYEIRKK